MKLVVEGKDHFELMWNLSKVINHRDFEPGVLTYFIFQPLSETAYELQKAERTYKDDMIFMEEVSSKIAGRKIYGLVSMNNNETALVFRALDSAAEFVLVNDEWILQCFEDFNIREESIAERRFFISSGFENLKKALA